MSAPEIRIAGLADVGKVLRTIAKRARLSMTATVDAGGTSNGSLIGIGTGNGTHKDTSLRPLLRVLVPHGWELVGRTIDPKGLVRKVPGGVPIMVCGPDGGWLEVPIDSMADVPLLFNTMAAANGLTMTALVQKTGASSTTLVTLATGNTPNADLRISNLTRLVAAAQFELVARPVHTTRRAARLAFAQRN